MGFLLDALHYPFELVLDNQLERKTLGQYQVVVLPDVQCMDDGAAEELEAYVRDGGTLIATGEAGVRDPLGEPRKRGVLDNLLGITGRSDALRCCELEIQGDVLRGDGLPDAYMVSGSARLVTVEPGVTVHATATETVHLSGAQKLWGGQSEPDLYAGVAVCERELGLGRAVFVAPDIGSGYSQNPNRRSRELIRRLIGNMDLPFTTDAPANVQVTVWRREGRLVFHLLNQPATMYCKPGMSLRFNPEDFTPTCPIRITLERAAKRVFSATEEVEVSADQENGRTCIRVESLVQHGVVVVELG